MGPALGACFSSRPRGPGLKVVAMGHLIGAPRPSRADPGQCAALSAVLWPECSEPRREGSGLGEAPSCPLGPKGGAAWLGGWGYCPRPHPASTLVMVAFVLSGGRWIGVGSQLPTGPPMFPLCVLRRVVRSVLPPACHTSWETSGLGSLAPRPCSRAAHLCSGHHRGRHLLRDPCPASHEGGGPGSPAHSAL